MKQKINFLILFSFFILESKTLQTASITGGLRIVLERTKRKILPVRRQVSQSFEQKNFAQSLDLHSCSFELFKFSPTGQNLKERVVDVAHKLVIQEGRFSLSELRAAIFMTRFCRNILLRRPIGTRRKDGETSDLLIDNRVTCDVYTPESKNPSTIVKGIAAKANQARVVIVDLSKTTLTADSFKGIEAELSRRKASSIRKIIFLKWQL